MMMQTIPFSRFRDWRFGLSVGIVLSMAGCVGPIKMAKLEVISREEGSVAALHQVEGYLASRNAEDPENYKSVLKFAGEKLIGLSAAEQAQFPAYAPILSGLSAQENPDDEAGQAFLAALNAPNVPGEARYYLRSVKADWATNELINMYQTETWRSSGSRMNDLMEHIAVHYPSAIDNPSIRQNVQQLIIESRVQNSAAEQSEDFYVVEEEVFTLAEIVTQLQRYDGGVETAVTEHAAPKKASFDFGSVFSNIQSLSAPTKDTPPPPKLDAEQAHSYLVQLVSAEVLNHPAAPDDVRPILQSIATSDKELVGLARKYFDQAIAAYLPTQIVEKGTSGFLSQSLEYQVGVLRGLAIAYREGRLPEADYSLFLGEAFDKVYAQARASEDVLFVAGELCHVNKAVCEERLASLAGASWQPLHKFGLMIAWIASAPEGSALPMDENFKQMLMYLMGNEAVKLPTEVQQVLLRNTMRQVANSDSSNTIFAVQRFVQNRKVGEDIRKEGMQLILEILQDAENVSSTAKSALKVLVHENGVDTLRYLKSALDNWPAADVYDLLDPLIANFGSVEDWKKLGFLQTVADLFEGKFSALPESQKKVLSALYAQSLKGGTERQKLLSAKAGFQLLKGEETYYATFFNEFKRNTYDN